jgi:hypothetical protein
LLDMADLVCPWHAGWKQSHYESVSATEITEVPVNSLPKQFVRRVGSKSRHCLISVATERKEDGFISS